METETAFQARNIAENQRPCNSLNFYCMCFVCLFSPLRFARGAYCAWVSLSRYAVVVTCLCDFHIARTQFIIIVHTSLATYIHIRVDIINFHSVRHMHVCSAILCEHYTRWFCCRPSIQLMGLLFVHFSSVCCHFASHFSFVWMVRWRWRWNLKQVALTSTFCTTFRINSTQLLTWVKHTTAFHPLTQNHRWNWKRNIHLPFCQLHEYIQPYVCSPL